MRSVSLLSFFGLIFLSPAVWSFPELIRHGYSNCTSCHISPSGGGVLTTYGRSLSKEILSTWSLRGEEKFAYMFKSKKWLALGGDVRFLDIKKDSHTAPATDRFIPMERDFEAAVILRKFTAVGTFGYQDPVQPETAQWFSRRHFLMYRPNDEISIRAGRFFPAFGIYIPEHATVIRQGLGWNEGQETYNLEFAWLNDKYNFYATGILGRPDLPALYREAGGAGSASFQASDTIKIGASYYYGGSDLWTHHSMGPFGIFGFTPNFFLLSQFDAIRSFASTYDSPQWGALDYQRLDYEIFQGFHLYLTQEFSQSDFTNNLTRTDVYGLGLQFFPRPHLEFQTFWQKKFIPGTSTPTDVLAFYFHFYP